MNARVHNCMCIVWDVSSDILVKIRDIIMRERLIDVELLTADGKAANYAPDSDHHPAKDKQSKDLHQSSIRIHTYDQQLCEPPCRSLHLYVISQRLNMQQHADRSSISRATARKEQGVI
ncbi:hypothetical protein MRB53_041703 [Persea americana]|nr:hypothetical protein MRB53_041703 [Persea americana]